MAPLLSVLLAARHARLPALPEHVWRKARLTMLRRRESVSRWKAGTLLTDLAFFQQQQS